MKHIAYFWSTEGPEATISTAATVPLNYIAISPAAHFLSGSLTRSMFYLYIIWKIAFAVSRHNVVTISVLNEWKPYQFFWSTLYAHDYCKFHAGGWIDWSLNNFKINASELMLHQKSCGRLTDHIISFDISTSTASQTSWWSVPPSIIFRLSL